MKALMYKELRLALQPISLLFLLLAGMILIPNYPYEVSFFYCCLGIMFVLQFGRENQDVQYTLLLPVAKSTLVKGRILLCMGIELAQLVISIPFAVLRNVLIQAPNLAGIDANITLFASGFLLFSLFNWILFSKYYQNVDRVGIPFLIASIGIFLYIALVIVATYAIPFVKNVLDTPDPQHLGSKLIVLGIALAIYLGSSAALMEKCGRSFEKLDL